MKLTAQIDVLAGAFASQQLAFAHLLDTAQAVGLSPDFDHIEVIPPPHTPRLTGYFDAPKVEELSRQARDETLILVLPGALITGTFPADARLRKLGNHTGQIVRAL